MSACPYAVRDIRFGTKLGSDPKLEDMMWASLTDLYCKTPMGVTAENLAEKYNLTREEVDEFAIRSLEGKHTFHFFGVPNLDSPPAVWRIFNWGWKPDS